MESSRVCYTCEEKFDYRNKNHRKVRDRYHYLEKYRGTVQ